MGIYIENISGRGILLEPISGEMEFIKKINPSYELSTELDNISDDLEICLCELDLMDNHLTMHIVGNMVTGKDLKVFIEVLTDLGEDIIKANGYNVINVNEVCIG